MESEAEKKTEVVEEKKIEVEKKETDKITAEEAVDMFTKMADELKEEIFGIVK